MSKQNNASAKRGQNRAEYYKGQQLCITAQDITSPVQVRTR